MARMCIMCMKTEASGPKAFYCAPCRKIINNPHRLFLEKTDYRETWIEAPKTKKTVYGRGRQ